MKMERKQNRGEKGRRQETNLVNNGEVKRITSSQKNTMNILSDTKGSPGAQKVIPEDTNVFFSSTIFGLFRVGFFFFLNQEETALLFFFLR